MFETIGVICIAVIVYAVLVWITMWLFKWWWIAITKVFEVIGKMLNF